jgi:hypothetical protein
MTSSFVAVNGRVSSVVQPPSRQEEIDHNFFEIKLDDQVASGSCEIIKEVISSTLNNPAGGHVDGFVVKGDLKKRRLVFALFEMGFFMVDCLDQNEAEFLFLHSPTCKELNRFFDSSTNKDNGRYRRENFSSADTFVPTYQDGILLPNTTSTLEGIFNGQKDIISQISLVGVLLECTGDKESILFAHSRPSHPMPLSSKKTI